jgi:hypothetical protein
MGQFLWDRDQRAPACTLLRPFVTMLIEGGLNRSSSMVGTEDIATARSSRPVDGNVAATGRREHVAYQVPGLVSET